MADEAIPDGSAPRSFTVIYTEDVLRDAVRTFVWRRFVIDQARMWIVALVMAGVVFAGLMEGGSQLGLTLAAIATLIPLALALIAWWVHGSSTLGAFRRMRIPRATFTLHEDEMDIASDMATGTVPWSALTEIWERPRFWMIFTARNQFNVIPKDNVPEETRAWFRARNRRILKQM
ncbi:YcxB family protein [Enterovirga rhinocerotis]|uniref:YcxB-like protein n=1 Tax=Enterovirga rhinocerotis TaxID=1339210 RepID=A0A4R7C7J6_9HYPH|nr:YcxB family protein [Enterovirga rhinocerotis]TDR94378.1 YcxB-like protein [Enterovirga rhinocerotis]